MTPSNLWRALPADLPVISTAARLNCDFYDSDEGTFAVSLSGALPSGRTILVATSKSRTTHWYQEGSFANGIFSVSMEGFEGAAGCCADPYWALAIGVIKEQGVVLHPLSHRGDTNYVKKLEPYFCDDRRRYGSMVYRFSSNGASYTAVPRRMLATGIVQLHILPVEDVYWEQICGVFSDIKVSGDTVTLCARFPKSIQTPPIGFSAHGVDCPSSDCFVPAKPVGEFAQTHTVTGTLSLSNAASDGQQVLCAVWAAEGKQLYRIPVRFNQPELAAQIQYRYESTPAAADGDEFLYLSVTPEHFLSLHRGIRDPGAQTCPDCITLADFLNRPETEPQYWCSVKNMGGSGWHWKLSLPSRTLSGVDEAVLLLYRKTDKRMVRCPVTIDSTGADGSRITADLSALPETLETTLRTNWIASLALRDKDSFWLMPLCNPTYTMYECKLHQTEFNDLQRCYSTSPVGSIAFAGREMEAIPFGDFDSSCSIMLADRCHRYYPAFTCRANLAQLHFGRLKLDIRCPKVNGTWIGITLARRYKIESDRQDYFFPLSKRIDCGDGYRLIASAPMNQFHFEPLYWDIRPVFEQDGFRYWSSIKAPIVTNQTVYRAVQYGIKGLFFGESMTLDKDNALFLYRTMGNRFALVCQERTPYSGFAFRLKERLAYAIYKLREKQLRKQSIYLTYEKYCCMAQDNGFYFFQYCMDHNMEQHMNRHIYFVINKKAVDYKNNLLPYKDHVIQFMSLKHMVYILAARLLISSDSKAHSYAWRAKESILLPVITKNKKLVFLQHGVIALKKVEFYRSGTNAVNLFITSNQQEHDIIVNEMAYAPEEVIITGLARWDVLQDRSAEIPEKRILIMPTWRNWLEEVSDETFRQSDYYQNYMALLNDPRLSAYLEQYNIYLDFYIHPKFRDYIGSFSSSVQRIRLIPFGSEPLNVLMMKCRMLITDYSSVCWDVYYQGKPVIFYQFDVEQYNETQGSYIDLEHDLFGDRAVNNEQLFALMKEAAETDFQLKPKYAAMREHMYEYIDRNNSRRVCEEILKRNW